MKKTIIFDFDGTIGDTAPLTISGTEKLSKEYGYPKHVFEDNLRNTPMRELLTKKLGLSIFQLPFFIMKMKKHMHAGMKKVGVIKGMGPVLKQLSKTHTVGILTTNSREIVDYVLKKGKVKVDFIYTDSSVFGKHRNIKSILRERGLEKQDVIYVGDEARDIIASKKAGIQCVAVTWGANSKKLLKTEQPDYLVSKPEELLKILQ